MNAPTPRVTGAPTEGAHGEAGPVQYDTALARLMDWFAGLFRRSANGVDTCAPVPGIDPRFDAEAIEKLLAEMRRQRMETSHGSIQMVHFGSLPQAIGRRWAQYVDRAMRLGESVLLKNLDLDDLYVRYADFAHIVVFADTEDHRAPIRANTLSEDIQHRLLLDRELTALVSVREVITRVTDLLEDDTPQKIRKLGEALDNNAKLREKEANKGKKRPAPSELAVSEKPSKKTETGKEEPVEQTKPKLKPAAKSENKFKALSGKAGDGQGSALPDWMGKFSAAFRPMLHISNRVVGIHAGVPMRVTPDHEKLYGEAVYPRGGEGDLTTAIDLIFTRYIVDELRLAVGAGNKSQISTMTTLNSLATSNELNKIIFDLNENESQQFIIEITGIRPSTPTGQLSETAGKLRGRVKSINLLMQIRDKKFMPFADIGVNAVGCNVSAQDLRKMSAEWVAEEMKKFVENAKSVKLGTYFHGVDTAYLLDAATKAGVDFIAGDAFEPAVGRPGTPRLLTG